MRSAEILNGKQAPARSLQAGELVLVGLTVWLGTGAGAAVGWLVGWVDGWLAGCLSG